MKHCEHCIAYIILRDGVGAIYSESIKVIVTIVTLEYIPRSCKPNQSEQDSNSNSNRKKRQH